MAEEMKKIEECVSKIVYDEKKDYGGKHLFRDNEAWIAYYKLIHNSESWIKYLLSHITQLESQKGELEKETNDFKELYEVERETCNRFIDKLEKAEGKIKELEKEIIKRDEYYCESLGAASTREGKIKELELSINIFKDERDELRSLHDAGIKEAYRICGVEDDGEYRWKWVLLELSTLVRKVKELTEGIENVIGFVNSSSMPETEYRELKKELIKLVEKK